MSIPQTEVKVPAVVLRLAAGAHLSPVWVNGIGGTTFRTTDGRFIKWGPLNGETTFVAEAERMRWAARFTPAPEVLSVGRDASHEWMMTVAMGGESAVAPRWVRDATAAVRAVGEGLRALHDALPVATCPFVWDVTSRIENARKRDVAVPAHLSDPPPVDKLVVCHGDACCPNTLIDESGRFAGHVDLGALGVGDRWADIAVAAMSTEWNYGPGFEGELIAAYGIDPDAERMAYYQALWNAT